MATKSTLSIVALVVTLLSANAFAVRLANPRIINELKAFHQSMADAGRLGELSDNLKQVCSCLEKGSLHDQAALVQAIREAQSHGCLVRAHAHPSLSRHAQHNVK